MVTPMCDFINYGISDKQKIMKKAINEDEEVWEDEPELEKLEKEEEVAKEKYISLTQ
jgi:hypothetical protein